MTATYTRRELLAALVAGTAAGLKAAGGELMVPKRKGANVTLAVARDS